MYPIVLSRTPDQVLTSAVPAVPQTPTTGAEAKESHSHSEATTHQKGLNVKADYLFDYRLPIGLCTQVETVSDQLNCFI